MDFARSAKYILASFIIFAGLLMGSCTAGGEAPEVPAAESPAGMKSEISFVDGGVELSSQKLAPGDFPTEPEVEGREGARFGGWIDENGRKALPGATPVVGDAVYTAVYFPLLDGEGPYLFTGGGGLLHPDDVLNSTELITALDALASDEAKKYFPDLSAAEDDVTVDELRTVLLGFYSSDELDRVILGHDGAEKISRSQFALIMNRLLERDCGAKVIPGGDSYRIPDIGLQRQDYSELMEATVPHEHSEEGSLWTSVQLTPMYEEGFVLVEGSLYCVDSEGFFVGDTVLGSLTFGYDGRYTSGDKALDAYVSAVIADIAEANCYENHMDLLRAAYNYCRDSFGFMRRNTYPIGARGWELSEANTMFETGMGNGASYAAVFWALARGLGYEATAVSGVIGQNRLPHNWVEIEIEGENYIFDPGAEAGALEDADMSRDRFMMSSDWASILKYVKE